MLVSDFDFELPEDRIALRPASPRESARLLVVRPGEGLDDRTVGDLPGLLKAGDALVFNDTRVIPARLFGTRHRDELEVRVEAILHRRLAPDRWTAFARPPSSGSATATTFTPATPLKTTSKPCP